MRKTSTTPPLEFEAYGLNEEQAQKLREAQIVVIVPVYNHAQFLERSLASVAAFFYPFPENVQLVIFDDASTDNSRDIIERCLVEYEFPFSVEFKKAEKNIRNRKRRIVFEQYQPDYMMTCCDDDIHYPYRLIKSVVAHIKTGAHVVTSNAKIINENGEFLNAYKSDANGSQTLEAYLRDGLIPTCFGAGVSHSKDIFRIFDPLPPFVRNSDLIIPFRAALLDPLRGNYFIQEPQLEWRQHAGMSSLNPADLPTRTSEENMKVRERWMNNMIANYTQMLDDIGRCQSTVKPDLSPQVAQRVLQRREHFIREWCKHRQDMSDAGFALK